ncbi:MAG: GerAB/ArcD/ProY family transporter [Clostridia bacterium]|nr:GerAB/ArcD/ProY family transporter [Clostridia bacterium]
MVNDNGKISLKQSLILFVLLFAAPAVRYVPMYAIGKANEAAWLVIIPALILGIIYMFVWNDIFKKHNKKCYLEIIDEMTGKFVGAIIRIIYFIWITLLVAYYLRMYAERILTSTMPNVHIIYILASMTIVLIIILKNDIVTLAKMGEIFFYLLGAMFIIYNLLILPEIHITNLLPVTLNDTVPILKGSMSIITLLSYLSVIFIFNDDIEHNGNFKKLSLSTLATILIFSFLIIVMPILVFGASVANKLPLPFFATMMQINLFDVIERIESGIIVFWMVSEFTLMAVFIYSVMHIIKNSFKIKNVRVLVTPYVFMIFFLALVLANSTLELKVLTERFLTPLNIAIGYCIPIIIYIIGKVRKKI